MGSYHGGVPELADGPDLGSGAAMRGGSSPPFPTFLLVNFSVLELLKSVQEVVILSPVLITF